MILTALVALSVGATETIDLLRLQPPAGWSREENASMVAWQQIDQSAGTFCRFVIGHAVGGTGSTTSDFNGEWQELVAVNMKVAKPPSPRAGKLPGGLAFIEGRADVVNAGNRFHYLMLAFSEGGRRQSAQIISGTESQVTDCRSKLDPVLRSLSLATTTTGAPSVKNTGDVGTWRGASPRGVWMANVFAPGGGSYAPTPRWLVLFDDGQSYSSIPRDGLLGFNRAASKAAGELDWGQWTWSGNKGGTQSLSNPRFTQTLSLDAGGRVLIVDTERYSPCPSVDGLTLDGAWTSYADPEDPQLAQLPVGQRPVIRFTRGGRFVDEGLLATMLMAPQGKTQGEAPGQGTYAIRDYTLTLTYDDGRVTNNALTGFMHLDPAKDAQRLMLRRALISRMRR